MSKLKVKTFDHNITLQLFDGNSFPVENTEFTIVLQIISEEIGETTRVTIKFPTLNFQVGQVSSSDPVTPSPGGWIGTNSGYLPVCIRPTDSLFQSFSTPTNDGLSTPFSFSGPYPNPLPGFILGIGPDGSINIQAEGQFSNLIPPGNHTLPPTTIVYSTSKEYAIKYNIQISPGTTNVTQFPDYAINTSLRDTHRNDAFNNILAWTWSDNSMEIDKTNGIMNCMVAVGEISDGKINVKYITQLTNLTQSYYQTFDNAVAINRQDPNNIVVSYGVGDASNFNGPLPGYRAISFDGGKTWPTEYNSNLNLSPGNGPRDVPGVKADKDGNFWYCISKPSGTIGGSNNTLLYISKDKGKTFSLVYTAPSQDPSGTTISYGFPQFCFGTYHGNYGVWLSVDAFLPIDIIPFIAFVQSDGTKYEVFLTNQLNTQNVSNNTASLDGRFWISSYCLNLTDTPTSTIRYKSPGNIDSNYAGPWQVTQVNQNSFFWNIPPFTSYPVFGYFNSAQTIIYDDKRQVLYAMFCNQTPIMNVGQNMVIYLLISGNNGQTWTKPIYISNTQFANRGFPSMALDEVTGNLVFGWYDGRNDKTMKSVQYFATFIPAKTLTEWVKKIPISNPTYLIPPPDAKPKEVKETPRKIFPRSRHLIQKNP